MKQLTRIILVSSLALAAGCDSMDGLTRCWDQKAIECERKDVPRTYILKAIRMFEESKQKAIEEGAVVTEHADIDIDAFKAIAIPIQDSFAEANGMTEQLEMIRNTAK